MKKLFMENLNRNIILGIAFVLLIFLIFLLYTAIYNENNIEEKNLIGEGATEWFYRIKKVGPEAAYKEFKEDNEEWNASLQHTRAHSFGRALFHAEGIKGITVCDDSYRFGCYHDLFLNVIRSHGLNALKDLDYACIERFGLEQQECQHGLGHGLLIYFGPQRMNEALEECAQLQWQEPLFGCSHGVFMEHNFPTHFEGEKIPIPRDFDEDNPYNPCNIIPEQFTASCLYELPNYWIIIAKMEYKKASKLCDGLDHTKDKKACFAGIGTASMFANKFDIDESIAACGEMELREGKMFCAVGLSFSFEYNNLYEKAELACASSANKEECVYLRGKLSRAEIPE